MSIFTPTISSGRLTQVSNSVSMRLILSCHIHLCARLSVLKCFKVLKDLGVGFWDWGREHNTGDYLSIQLSIPNSLPRSSLVTQPTAAGEPARVCWSSSEMQMTCSAAGPTQAVGLHPERCKAAANRACTGTHARSGNDEAASSSAAGSVDCRPSKLLAVRAWNHHVVPRT